MAYGRRLIPNIIDERALVDPERTVYSIPLAAVELRDTSSRGSVHSVPTFSSGVSQGFKDISARAFANAVDRTAWWLEAELGRGSSFPSVGYIGPRTSGAEEESQRPLLILR